MVITRFITIITISSIIHGVRSIVGGRIANEGQFKYMVSIWIFGDYVCGGGIIDATHVLTAAHCVYDEPNCGMSVVAGETSFPIRPSAFLCVEKSILHPNYTPPNFDEENYERPKHDIAVLRLKTSLVWGPKILPVPLVTSSFLCFCCVGEMAGWGDERVTSRGEPSQYLKWTTAILVKAEWCIAEDASCFLNELCAQDPRGTSIIGQGDSGGPFVSNGVALGVILSKVHRFGKPLEGQTIVLSIFPYLGFISETMNNTVNNAVYDTENGRLDKYYSIVS